MSIPIVACDIYKAALGDEEKYKTLLKHTRYNMTYGHWTTFPCRCNPQCEIPTQEQFDALNKRLNEELKKEKE